MDSKISKVTQSLTSAEDMRNQTKLIMQPYANWEEYLTPAPLSIAIMGELVFISSSTDFSINKNPPKECKLREQSAQETKQRTENAVKAMGKELDEAHESYRKAMDSLPSGWEMIGMDFVDGLAQSFTGLVNGLTSIFTFPAKIASFARTKNTDTWNNQESVRDMVAEINIYCKSSEILNWVQKIQEEMKVNSEDDDIAWTNLYDQKNKMTKTNFMEEQFKRINGDLKKIPDCQVKKRAETLCKEGMEICNQLAKYAPDGKCDKNITNSPAISPKLPMMQKEENKSENMSASQKATANSRFAIEQSRAQMNKTRENYDKCIENLEKNQKELTDILVAMRNCELKEIDFKTTIKMLVKGMEAMGRVKVQWEKMVHFFQMVSNIIKTSLSKTQALSYNAKLFSKDMLYSQAFQACNIASLVHMISGTYTDISNKYLMDRVSSLGKLMAMDKSKPEFEQERLQLQDSCDEAQQGIIKLVLKNKEEFERKSTARLEKIDRELLAILPAAPPEEIKSIQEVVKAGFSEEEEASYY
ncbi:hypothetical protein PO909_009169 [Leuciscus waleckii]